MPFLLALLLLTLFACSTPPEPSECVGPVRDLPAGPWQAYHEPSEGLDLDRLAQTFRLIDIDADPALARFTPEEIATLKAGGRNRVISYMNVGTCESWRTHWTTAPGCTPCGENTAAQLRPLQGWTDETWMNPANRAYQDLLLDCVAPRLVERGVDGFFLDNMDMHWANDAEAAPCDAACFQGAIDFVRRLRERYPNHLIILNGISDDLRLGMAGGTPLPLLIDGISREGTYLPDYNPTTEAQLAKWRDMGVSPGCHPLWIGTLDYLNTCEETDTAASVIARSRAQGFTPAVERADPQGQICFWSSL